MNEYQKALNKIVNSSCPNCTDDNGCSSCDIQKICNCHAKSWVNTLQKLVDKENPMKPIDGMTGLTFKDAHKCKLCPKCKGKGMAIKKEWKYCPNCGQKLDWSDE